MKIQPIRIVLINSANCQYANFDLSDSLHLVALNNRGKTSIINTLQLLYINSYKELDMGYALDDTWKHYFPRLGSYVLFEINTLTGNKVFGLSATGMGAQPEKFLLDGAYKTEDFIEKKDTSYIAYMPKDLFPALGQRLIKRGITPKNHKDLLKPFQVKNNTIGLGIIGDNNDYRLFKLLFKQLLQLKNITISDLKKQIELVNQRTMEKQQTINIQREFNEPYREIEKQKYEMQRLHDNRSNITELLELNERQTKLRGRLCSYFFKADSLFINEDETLQAERINLIDSKKRIEDEQLPSIKLKKEEKQDKISHLNQDLGVLKRQISDYIELEKQCQNILPKVEESKHANLIESAEILQKQLYQVEDADIDILRESLVSKEKHKDEYQLQLEHIQDTLFLQLKNLLSEHEITLLYQLTNGQLWNLFNGKGFELSDQKALQAFLRKQMRNHQDGEWKFPGLTLNTNNISTTGLQELGNPEFLRQKITTLTREISKEQQQLTTLGEQAKLRKELKGFQDQITICMNRMHQYDQWEWSQEQYQQWINNKETLQQEIEKYKTRVAELDKEKDALTGKLLQYEQYIQSIAEKQRTINQQKTWIEQHPPENGWEKVEVNYETATFDDLSTQYQKHHKELQQIDSDIHHKLVQFRNNFRQMAGMDESQCLQFLREQLDAIPEKEKSIQDQWKGIFSSFAAHCRGMIDSVSAIDSYLADLNRLLGKHPISNLKSVKISVETNQWHRHILRIKEWREDDLVIFGGLDEAAGEKLQQAIKPLLQKVEIKISDLYELKLRVTDQHDREKLYNSLQLESNGTSITVKTLIFISMINKAMQGKQQLGESIRIPFYVDEIDSLDDDNAQNIHDTAQKLGLIPVFASPKGSGICKRLYQLENNYYGKVSVRKKSKGKLILLKPTFEQIG